MPEAERSALVRPSSGQVFLATVTEGAELVRAFGHVALVFQELGAGRSTPGAEGDLVAYGYGGYVLPDIRPRLDAFGLDRIWDAVGSAAFESLRPVVDGTLRVSKARQSLADFRRQLAPEQDLLLDELRLTAVQRERLHRRVVEDFARIEPGERKPGIYRYDHFRSNCATRLRDDVFGALGEDGMLPAHRRETGDSFERIIEESLAAAIASSESGLRLFPPAWAAGLAMLLPSVPTIARDPGDFLRALRLVLEGLGAASVFATPAGKKALARALHVLTGEVPRPARSHWETLLTPRRLRKALLDRLGDTSPA